MTQQLRSYVPIAKDLRGIADAIEENDKHPYGPPPDPKTVSTAGDACVALCGGDRDKARTLWKLIQKHHGYMPYAAASALIFASNHTNLVPDIEAPEPT